MGESQCFDINECVTLINEGGFLCSCQNGYELVNGRYCNDVDECAIGSDDCDINASCQNTDGGFRCTCDDGYQGNGWNCTGKSITYILSPYYY